MATTTFDKPVGTEIQQLNSKITPNDITSKISASIGTLHSNSKVYEIGNIIIADIILSGVSLNASSNWTDFISLSNDFPSAIGTLAGTYGDCNYLGVNKFGTKIQAMTNTSFSNKYVHIFGTLVKS